MIVPGFTVICSGNHLVGCQHITLPGVQPGACHELCPGIHLHIVIRVSPGHTQYTACAGLGGPFGRNLLQRTNIRIFRDVPCAGQRSRVGGFGIHRNRSSCAPGRSTARVTVRKAFGRIVATCADFQVFQFCSLIASCPAFGFHKTLVIAFSFGVAGSDRCQQTDTHITDNSPAAGIVLGNEGQVGIRSRNRFFLFFSLVVFRFFFLFGLIGFFSHGNTGCRLRDGLCFVGRNTGGRHICAVCLCMGHIRAFPANYRLGKHRVSQKAVAVRHRHGRLRLCRSAAVHDGNSEGRHACSACFGFQYRCVG